MRRWLILPLILLVTTGCPPTCDPTAPDCSTDSTGTSDDPNLARLEGTWRLNDNSLLKVASIKRWWSFELIVKGNRVRGVAGSGVQRQSFPGLGIFPTVWEFPAGRPIAVEIRGSQVTLRFDMDDEPGDEELTGLLDAAGMMIEGVVWEAQRVLLPESPTDLQLSAVSANQAALTWSDNSAIETGFLLKARCCGADFIELGELPADATSVTLTELNPGTSYDVRVRALIRDRWEGQTWVFSSNDFAEASFRTP